MMTPIFLTGTYKIVSEKDFPMQVYSAYIIETITMSLPILILQVINNTLMQNWRMEVLFSVAVLALNLVLGIRGIVFISDKMAQDRSDHQRRILIKRH